MFALLLEQLSLSQCLGPGPTLLGEDSNPVWLKRSLRNFTLTNQLSGHWRNRLQCSAAQQSIPSAFLKPLLQPAGNMRPYINMTALALNRGVSI